MKPHPLVKERRFEVAENAGLADSLPDDRSDSFVPDYHAPTDEGESSDHDKKELFWGEVEEMEKNIHSGKAARLWTDRQTSEAVKHEDGKRKVTALVQSLARVYASNCANINSASYRTQETNNKIQEARKKRKRIQWRCPGVQRRYASAGRLS